MEEKEKKKMNVKARIHNIFQSTIKTSTCAFTAKGRPDSVEPPTFIPSSFSNRHCVTDNNLILRRSLSLPSFSDRRKHHQFIFSDPNNSKKKKKKKKKNKKNKKKNGRSRTKFHSNPYGFTTPTLSEVGSDDDDDEKEEETETLFSSRSFSNDSSDFYYSKKKTNKRHHRRFRQIKGKDYKINKKDKKEEEKEEGLLGGGGDAVAVVVETEDPYEDFKVSMVEMVVEKKIFGVKELDGLLHCYLSLNSPDHHSIILTVFSDICEVLFC